MPEINIPLKTFLSRTLPGKEVSLYIVSDTNNVERAEASLRSLGFSKAATPILLFYGIKNGEQLYITLTENNAKQIYDITAQFPTGEINFFDHEKMSTLRITPDYERAAVVVLTPMALLKSIEDHGLAFRSITGLAYQE